MGGSTKQALLQALSAAEGAYISGQQLAEALGVSRAAVHKAAQALLAQGYALDSAPRRGYRLAGGDPFCAEAVGLYPAPIHIYDTLQSSNLTAKQLALGGAPHGTLVLTAHQKAGRGRLVRKPCREGGLPLPHPAARPLCRRCPECDHQCSGGRGPGCQGPLRAGAGHQMGERPLLSGPQGLRHPDRSRDRHGMRSAGMAGGGHRPQPDHLLRRLARGAGPHGRQPLPRRPRTREPGGAGRGHCPGAARPSTVWTSTGPAVLCRATGSLSAPGPIPMPQRPFPLTMRAVWWWSARAADRLPCSMVRSASGRPPQHEK